MKLSLFSAVLLTLTTTLPLPLLADEAGHAKAAGELVSLFAPRETMISTIMASSEAILQQVPEDKKEAVKKAYQKFAETIADDPDMKTKMVEIYQESFTEAELKELLAFYSTPTGKKTLEKLPELMQKGMNIGMEVAQKNQAAFMGEIQKIMETE